MAKRDKPLVQPTSPFWQYRMWHSMFLSILHRITGVAMSVGSALLVYWLVAAASGPESYAQAQAFFLCVWVQIALIGWVFSFCYHFFNGLRHLVWDTGRGFGLTVSRNSGYAVLAAAVVFTVLIVAVFARAGGAA
jgi:succinate dehydrogenase / fumarate reductase cytochrome b subunit